MDSVDRDTLVRLAGTAGWPSVSVYLPTTRISIHADADRVRLRNLVRDATAKLVEDGVRAAEARTLMKQAADFAADDASWNGGTQGLALFIGTSGTTILKLDTAMPERMLVADRFYLRPLYRADHEHLRFWALAVDLNRTRLFHCDPSSIAEVALPAGTPVSFEEETRYDTRDVVLQSHSTTGGAAPQKGAAMWHGHGGEKDSSKVQRGRFMRSLAKGIIDLIQEGGESEPLILLGVDYLLADLRMFLDYPNVAPDQVQGATDELSGSEVHAAAMKAIAPYLSAFSQRDVDEYHAQVGSGLASSDPATIATAAAGGRVKTLLMDDGEGPWGWFDPESFEVTRMCPVQPRYLRDTMNAEQQADPAECGWDLVDLAAAETITRGGVVRAFSGEDSPIHGVAAVFRY